MNWKTILDEGHGLNRPPMQSINGHEVVQNIDVLLPSVQTLLYPKIFGVTQRSNWNKKRKSWIFIKTTFKTHLKKLDDQRFATFSLASPFGLSVSNWNDNFFTEVENKRSNLKCSLLFDLGNLKSFFYCACNFWPFLKAFLNSFEHKPPFCACCFLMLGCFNCCETNISM